ncbi:ribonuclease H-like domain-containing protein [Scheffersomyces coipomensis]|uniref:ribonuclease H-like domain-containing protein n=1 Tax=Scheffersomyces coipomensis TaxID=1788519 RepID=UPI00315C539A
MSITPVRSISTNVETSTSSSALLDLINKTKKVTVKQPLVWIDCEMTGLEVFQDDHIIEICCIITDGDLNIIEENGYESTVYYDKQVLDNMNEWCVTQHTKSGLVAKILSHPEQTLEKVNQEIIEYVKKYIPQERVGILAGNSIHMDKFFLMKEFKPLIDHLHYRLVDVSSIMEMGNRHNPRLMRCYPKKKGNHTAKSDILESLEQLKWYRDHYLKSENEVKSFIEDYESKQVDIEGDDSDKVIKKRKV